MMRAPGETVYDRTLSIWSSMRISCSSARFLASVFPMTSSAASRDMVSLSSESTLAWLSCKLDPWDEDPGNGGQCRCASSSKSRRASWASSVATCADKLFRTEISYYECLKGRTCASAARRRVRSSSSWDVSAPRSVVMLTRSSSSFSISTRG